MAVSYLSISAVCTVLSFVGLQYWTGLSLEKLTSDGVISQDSVEPGNALNVLQLPSGSQATVALLANFALNVFLLLILSVKACKAHLLEATCLGNINRVISSVGVTI
ncbi:hypothetical protein Acr_03g0000550 [Actinidia rufa]|uniref:Uncharacterized protein n=1 Tax=Actinidia rufa TaxID=165716 RepID=A0A7J0E9V4_9ERIC|nr:hypothetical protein Acr_03g0000550 [Actinidia rufa]